MARGKTQKMARAALVTFVILLSSACSQHVDVQSRAKKLETLYGNTIPLLSENTVWTTSHRVPVYQVTVAVPDGTDADARQKLEDMVFQEFAGPRATLLGFRSVQVLLDDGNRSGVILFGFPVTISASTGPGPLPGPEDLFEENADRTWSRHSDDAPVINYVETASIKSGEKFGLAYSIENFPNATYIYDCVPCDGSSKLLFPRMYGLIKQVVIPEADREKLRSVRLVVFLAQRKNLWDFPRSVDLHLQKHPDGRWYGPNSGAEKFEANFNHLVDKFRDMGRQMRGERTKQ